MTVNKEASPRNQDQYWLSLASALYVLVWLPMFDPVFVEVQRNLNNRYI